MYQRCVKCLKYNSDQGNYRWPCGHIHCHNCHVSAFGTVYDPDTGQSKTVQVLQCAACQSGAAQEDATKKRISNLENQVKQQSEVIASLKKRLEAFESK